MRYSQDSRGFQQAKSIEMQKDAKPAKNSPESVLAAIAAAALGWFGKARTRRLHPGHALQHGKTQGRNEPCFCGSGKKFKKCCLEKCGE